MDVIRNDQALLTIGTFLPLAGVLVMMFIPRRKELLHKQIALVTALATMAVGIFTLTQFDYDQAGKLQFFVNVEWIPVIHSNYTIGVDGMSLPLYILSMVVTLLVMVYSWDHIPDPGNAKAFLDADARAADRHGRHVRGRGPDPVLRVLRARAAADVLHDRRVGRRAAPVRVAQVLPLHDVRIGTDARRLPRPVLAGVEEPCRRARPASASRTSPSTAVCSARRCRSGSSPACSSASP